MHKHCLLSSCACSGLVFLVETNVRSEYLRLLSGFNDVWPLLDAIPSYTSCYTRPIPDRFDWSKKKIIDLVQAILCCVTMIRWILWIVTNQIWCSQHHFTPQIALMLDQKKVTLLMIFWYEQTQHEQFKKQKSTCVHCLIHYVMYTIANQKIYRALVFLHGPTTWWLI